LKQSTAIGEFIGRGQIDKLDTVTSSDTVPRYHRKLDSHQSLQEVFDTSKITKELSEILAPLETSNDPQFILIKGAPGIGKSFLLKEIAYRWGKKEILSNFKLVLLVCLRDPTVQEMLWIDDLFHLFCKRDKEGAKIASACSKYFLDNNGEGLAFLFDGYDEYPKVLQRNGLIADILKRKELPRCGLIVSSRPHDLISLREQATVKVDILGFTEVEREHYIKETMEGQPQKIDELTRYLQGHSTINSLCYVPFNMVVLAYLCKQGNPLPKSSAELYSHFICHTIYQNLIRHDYQLQSSLTKLTNLPEPYYKIIKQLSELSLESLNKNKLIFTIDEIKAACPNIISIAGAIDGFGLLHSVKHFDGTGTTITFNFLHLSIQEYLAAHYVSNLPYEKELKIIKDKFSNACYFNTLSIYIALTKGRRPAFKHFLSGGNKAITISDSFLKNQLLCFHLYRCFHEAGDVNICKTIERSVTFSNKVINLYGTLLSPNDVECITLFLISSFHKKWVTLGLSSCHIQDCGLHILYRGLLCSDITIDQLWLEGNDLTTQSSPLISELTVKCKVKELWISRNHNIGEDKQLYSMLTDPSTMLDRLIMHNIKLSSRAAIALFKALKGNNKLYRLYIDKNDIGDDACEAISTALEKNSGLVELSLLNNPQLTGEAIVKILNGLKANNTLVLLEVSKCSEVIKKRIISQQEVINKKRESQGCQVKNLLIHFG